jgi:hypothetical protein
MYVKPLAGGGEIHPNAFKGPVNFTAVVKVDPQYLTNKEVDSRGWLKPQVPLMRNGRLASAVATPGEALYGCVVEPVKIATGNTAPELLAADEAPITVATICQINRAILEDTLGRPLSPGELAASNAPGGGVVVFVY